MAIRTTIGPNRSFTLAAVLTYSFKERVRHSDEFVRLGPYRKMKNILHYQYHIFRLIGNSINLSETLQKIHKKFNRTERVSSKIQNLRSNLSAISLRMDSTEVLAGCENFSAINVKFQRL